MHEKLSFLSQRTDNAVQVKAEENDSLQLQQLKYWHFPVLAHFQQHSGTVLKANSFIEILLKTKWFKISVLYSFLVFFPCIIALLRHIYVKKK